MNIKRSASKEIIRTTLESSKGLIQLQVDKPVKIRGGGYVCCTGVARRQIRFRDISVGLDSLQALYYALAKLGARLTEMGEYSKLRKNDDVLSCVRPILLETEFIQSRSIAECFCLWKNPVDQIFRSFWSDSPKTLLFRKPPATIKLLASREFVFRSKTVALDIFLPKRKSNQAYQCQYQLRGLTGSAPFYGYSVDPIHAILLAYDLAWKQLALLESDLRWKHASPGQLGMPVLLPGHNIDSNWSEKYTRRLKVHLMKKNRLTQ